MLRYNMDIGLHKNIKNIFKNKEKVIILHEEARHRISTDSNYIFKIIIDKRVERIKCF